MSEPESMNDVIKRITGQTEIAKAVNHHKELAIEVYEEFLSNGVEERDAYLLTTGAIESMASTDEISLGLRNVMQVALDEHTGMGSVFVWEEDDWYGSDEEE